MSAFYSYPIDQKDLPTRSQMREWMAANVDDYDGATALAEAAIAYWDLRSDWLDDPDPWVWIWEEAWEAQRDR